MCIDNWWGGDREENGETLLKGAQWRKKRQKAQTAIQEILLKCESAFLLWRWSNIRQITQRAYGVSIGTGQSPEVPLSLDDVIIMSI